MACGGYGNDGGYGVGLQTPRGLPAQEKCLKGFLGPPLFAWFCLVSSAFSVTTTAVVVTATDTCITGAAVATTAVLGNGELLCLVLFGHFLVLVLLVILLLE